MLEFSTEQEKWHELLEKFMAVLPENRDPQPISNLIADVKDFSFHTYPNMLVKRALVGADNYNTDQALVIKTLTEQLDATIATIPAFKDKEVEVDSPELKRASGLLHIIKHSLIDDGRANALTDKSLEELSILLAHYSFSANPHIAKQAQTALTDYIRQLPQQNALAITTALLTENSAAINNIDVNIKDPVEKAKAIVAATRPTMEILAYVDEDTLQAATADDKFAGTLAISPSGGEKRGNGSKHITYNDRAVIAFTSDPKHAVLIPKQDQPACLLLSGRGTSWWVPDPRSMQAQILGQGYTNAMAEKMAWVLEVASKRGYDLKAALGFNTFKNNTQSLLTAPPDAATPSPSLPKPTEKSPKPKKP